jgi:hypothetical protein
MKLKLDFKLILSLVSTLISGLLVTIIVFNKPNYPIYNLYFMKEDIENNTCEYKFKSNQKRLPFVINNCQEIPLKIGENYYIETLSNGRIYSISKVKQDKK